MKHNLVQSLINNNIIQEDERSIYEYALFVGWFNILCILVVLIIGAILHELKTSCIFLLSFIPIRVLSGGFHLKSPLKCICFFSICYTIVLLFYLNFGFINIPLFSIIVIINYFLIFNEYKRKLKIFLPLSIFILIESIIILFLPHYYIIQYSIIFNFMLYLLPKILKLFNQINN